MSRVVAATPPPPENGLLRTWLRTGWAPVLWFVALAALGWYACLFAVHAWRLIHFPYQANYGEGAILYQTHLLLQGRSPYHNDAGPPFIVANYPPVYLVATALLEGLGLGPGFAAGRLLSAAAVAVAALFIGLGVRTTVAAGAPRPSPAAAWAAGAFAAGLLLAQFYIWNWGPVERVDSLALAWQAVGLWVVLRRPQAAAGAWPWFLLAVLTRQSSIEGLVAAVWFLWRRHPRAARGLLRNWVVALALASAALTAATAGQFLLHVVLYNANHWSLRAYLGQLTSWIFPRGGLPLLVLALVGWRQARDWPGAPLWGNFALVAFAVALTAGKTGSSVNYFFPSIAAAAALAGIGAATLRRRLAGALLLCVYAVGVPPLADAGTGAGAVARALTAYRDLHTPAYWPLAADATATGADPVQAALLTLLRGTQGPILSENMGVLILSGHRVYFQPFALTQVHADGHWNDAPVVGLAARGGYPLVVLEFPLERPTAWDTGRWAPNLLRALASNYVRVEHLGRYYVYRPRAS